MTYTEPHTVVLQPLRDRVLWMETRRERDHVEIVASGCEAYAEAENSESIGDAERLHDALDRIAAKLSTNWMSTYACVVMIPNARLTARALETPPIDDEALDEMIAFEVSETLQIDADAIAWDWMASSKAEVSEHRNVFWVAARSSFIQEMLQAWPASLVRPTLITTDFWGMYESLLHSPGADLQSPTLIAIHQHETLTLVVATQQSIQLMRTVRVASSDETPPDTACWREIARTLSYANSAGEEAIQQVILAGISATTDAATRFVESTSLAVHSVDQQEFLNALKCNADSISDEHTALTAFSWCHHHHRLTCPNLLRSKKATKHWVETITETLQPSRTFLTYASTMLAAIVILAIGGYFWHGQAVAARIDAGDELIKVARYLDKEETGLRELVKTDFNYGDFFVFLSETLPDRVLVESVNISNELEITFALTGANNQQVVTLVQQLNDSLFFKEIVSDRVSAGDNGQVFYLRGELRPGGRARP